MLLAAFTAAPAWTGEGAVYNKVPDTIDTGAKYIFYMHGLAIEQGGKRAEQYNYNGILKKIAERGFVVIGEERGKVKNVDYAKKVTGQVRSLLKAGVPSGNITVAGHSKGGMMTMQVMAMLAEPDIAYVNFAGCGKQGSGFEGHIQFGERMGSKARGRLLSAYDRSDTIAGSCRKALDQMTGARVAERVLNIGGGHELFYDPNDKWIDVLTDWADRKEP